MIRRLPPRGRLAGFTLLELIVAAGILALIAVFSWRGLDSLIREREAIAASQQTLDALSRAFARIERDTLLARDAELDESGVLRLVANPAAGGGAAVEYRPGQNALVRRVAGESGAITLIDGVGTLSMELWVPGGSAAAGPGGQRVGGGGGTWVRSRQVVAAPVEAAPAAGANATPSANANGVPNASAAPAGSTPPPQATPAGAPPASPGNAAPALPAVITATGLRIAIARPDGGTLVRTFLIGSGG